MSHSSQTAERGVRWYFALLTVIVSTSITCFWAMWGILENFHEGWYHTGLVDNLILMFGQYLSPMLGFVMLTLVSIRWHVTGAILHFLVAAFMAWFFRNSPAGAGLIATPMTLLGIAYLTCRVPCPWRAMAFYLVCVCLTLVGFGIEPAYRVAHRFNDGHTGMRIVPLGDRRIAWAPAGPGWPDSGVTWEEAKSICSRLSREGTVLLDHPVHEWRLPTAEELVAAQYRHDLSCEGVYDAETRAATYQRRPDKETPLWNPHSQVIYLWSATEVDADTALIIAYDGRVWPRPKSANRAYLAFRAVKTLDHAPLTRD